MQKIEYVDIEPQPSNEMPVDVEIFTLVDESSVKSDVSAVQLDAAAHNSGIHNQNIEYEDIEPQSSTEMPVDVEIFTLIDYIPQKPEESKSVEQLGAAPSLVKNNMQHLVIQAKSAGLKDGNYAAIILNHHPVKMKKGSDGNDLRGLHIVLVDPESGKIKSKKVFDTYKSSEKLEKHIRCIPDNLIVIAACKDEISLNLSETSQQWFENMGSTEISHLEFKRGYVFIGKTGQDKALEKKATAAEPQVSISQIFSVNGDYLNETQIFNNSRTQKIAKKTQLKCPNCINKIKPGTKNEQHFLQCLTKPQKEFFELQNFYSCKKCEGGQQIYPSYLTPVYHCQTCFYGLCEPCSQKTLEQQIKEEKLQQFSSGWKNKDKMTYSSMTKQHGNKSKAQAFTKPVWKNTRQLDRAINKVSFVKNNEDSDLEEIYDEDTIKNIVNFYKFKDEANSDYDEDQNFSESHYDNFEQIDENLKKFQNSAALGSL